MKAAIYCRLSKEDEEQEKKDREKESESIQNHDVIYKGWITPPKITS